ncbi:MAG: hypothetical protein RLZZ500_2596 [Bacteroidota bacterium]|jgi:hypothetical protein
MKKRIITVFGLGILLTALSCKQQENAVTDEKSNEALVAADTVANTDPLTTVAADTKNDKSKKLVRTGEVRVRVNDVVESTHRIENAVSAAGGFVTHTKMESKVEERKETEISNDSLLISTQYHTENDMVVRVPTAQLNSVLQAIAKEVEYVDYRNIDTEDVTLQFVANSLESKRKNETSLRLEKGIDGRSAKLNQVIEAENEREAKASERDVKQLENKQLDNKVNYATLALKLYQNSVIKQERIASMERMDRLQPAFGTRAWNNIKTGWFAFESIFSFLLLFWPVGLLGGLGYYGYKRFAKK